MTIAAEIELVAGMILLNEDRREFTIGAVTTRIVTIYNGAGDYVESVSHMFARCKYSVKKG